MIDLLINIFQISWRVWQVPSCSNILLCVYVCVFVLSRVRLCDPKDCSPQAPLSMGFSRQEYWSGLPFPPPGDLPDPVIQLTSPGPPALAGEFFTTSATCEAPHSSLLPFSPVSLSANKDPSSQSYGFPSGHVWM